MLQKGDMRLWIRSCFLSTALPKDFLIERIFIWEAEGIPILPGSLVPPREGGTPSEQPESKDQDQIKLRITFSLSTASKASLLPCSFNPLKIEAWAWH